MTRFAIPVVVVLLVLLPTLVCADKQDLEIPLKILLNQEDKGEYFVLLAKDEDILIRADDIERLGIRAVNTAVHVKHTAYVSLKRLRPQVSYSVNESSLSLQLSVDPHLLNKTVVSATPQTKSNNLFGIDSAFLNYSFPQNGASGQAYSQPKIPLEAVVNAHGFLLRSQFYYTQIDGASFWSRTMSNITRDIPNKLLRLTLGDVAVSSGELGSSGIYAGLNISRVFSLSPYFAQYPGLDVSGLLETSSTVDVYVNNVLVRSERLPAGQFEINDLPNVYGSGEAFLKITDVFGRERVLGVPYYVSNRLLKKNVHEYSYTIGFKQQNLNNEVVGANWDVGYKTSHPTVMAFHRYGFRRWLTLGLRGEADPDLQNLGPMLNVLMSRKGELSAGMAISRSAAKSAKAAYARYYYTSKFFHLRSDISYFDENYAHHNLPPGVVRTKQSQNVGAGLHGLKLGSISFNYNETQYHRETASQRLSVVLSTRIGRLTSLLLRATQMQTAGVFSNSMLLSLHTSLGRRAAANASYTQDEDHFNQNFYIHETAPAGRGIGYRLRLGETEQTKNNGDWVGDASLRVKNKFALISSDVTKAVGYKSYQTSISGSLAFVDNEFFLTQPIRDSFALVKAGQLDDIQVFYNNEPMGRTQKGRLIIPNLTSYAKNSLSIDASALPVNMSLHNDRQTISPSFRSGGVAEFELEKFQGFVGHIYFRQGMQRKPADYAEYRIKTAQGSIDSIVGLRGEIYLENLHPGSYAGKLFYKGEQCDFEINVPQSEELQVELEDVYCEI